VRPALVILWWGVGLAAIGAVGVLFFDVDEPETPALFAGSALLMVVLGATLPLFGLGGREEERTFTSPDLSPATVWLGGSLVLLAVGSTLGLWLVLIACGSVGVGVGGLIRELRAQREAAGRSARR
jgi:hypothetical protein